MAKIGFTSSTPDGGGADLGNLFVIRDIFSQYNLFLWGDNTSGAIGITVLTNQLTPTQTTTGGATWDYATGGRFTSAAIKTDNTLWVWGGNDAGQLGINSTTILSRTTPVQVSGGGKWKSVACGKQFMAAVQLTGGLFTTGTNADGQLGSGNNTARTALTQVGASLSWKQVACGYRHTMAIKTDGTLWGFGYNTDGELGIGNTVASNSPTQVTATRTGSTVNNDWSIVQCGFYHTVALKTDGSLWACGYNEFGQIGDSQKATSALTMKQIGTDNWSVISAGRNHTSGIKTDNTLWSWGSNIDGQMGMNLDGGGSQGPVPPSYISSLTPVQPQYNSAVDGGPWKSVSCGKFHTAALKTDGTFWTWGYNTDGELGIGTSGTATSKTSPNQVTGGGTNWTKVGAGHFVTYGLKIGSI